MKRKEIPGPTGDTYSIPSAIKASTELYPLKVAELFSKKIIILITAFVLIANILLANTNGNGIPEAIVSEFSKSFSEAKEIRCENFGSYYKATFSEQRNTFYVFYSDIAEFVGIASNILSNKLPGSSQAGIKNKFAGYCLKSG